MGVTCFVEDASVVAVQQRVSYSCFALHCYWWGIRVPCRCRVHRPREEDAPSGVCFVATDGVRMLSGGSFWPLSAPRGEIGGSPSGDGFCGPSRCCGGGCVFWYLLLASVRISTPNSFQHLRLDADPQCGAGVRFSVVPLWAGEGGGGGVRDARGGPPGDRDLLRRRVAACVFSGCGWWRFETGGRR